MAVTPIGGSGFFARTPLMISTAEWNILVDTFLPL
jgi:hypothetical protein